MIFAPLCVLDKVTTDRVIYVKAKWSRCRAQRVGRGIALLFHDRGTRRGWVVSSTPRPHFTLGKDPSPILQEAGWAPGPVWTGGKSRPHRDSIPDRRARSSVAIPTELPGPRIIYAAIIINRYTRRLSDLMERNVSRYAAGSCLSVVVDPPPPKNRNCVRRWSADYSTYLSSSQPVYPKILLERYPHVIIFPRIYHFSSNFL